MRILVVDDETELREAIARRLRAHGHGVDEASDLRSADEQLFVHHPALVILDRMLPDGDGLSLLRDWRQAGHDVPVLLLTARDGVDDRVEGLSSGADDYLVKPFAMQELLARVSAIARRQGTPTPSVVQLGELEIDMGRRELRQAGVLIALRPKEWVLLTLLVAAAGQLVTRQQILEACWDENHEPNSNVEEVLVASLRRKLGSPSRIRTVRGAGYLLEVRARGD